MKLNTSIWVIFAICAALGIDPGFAQAPPSSCEQCHGDIEMFGPEGPALVDAVRVDIHREAGISCEDCHGGNPDPELALDLGGAMDPGFQANPYIGVPERAHVPDFCGRCHSDATYIRRFRPEMRIDQVEEYWTSHHGQGLRQGDPNVATCVDCHGVHGIRAVNDTQSPVFARNVAQTCSQCHSDPVRMGSYQGPGGGPLPTDQHVLWEMSVHGKALLEGDDLSAPTCNDCHGNHGAVPPGVQSISFVCGQCHGREAQLFRNSPKEEGFRQHEEFLADLGSAECQACHELPEAFAQVDPIHTLTECSTCHGNHGVRRPTLAMLGALPETPCDVCHGLTAEAGEVVEAAESEERESRARESLLAEGRALGLEGAALFDWLVDRTLTLPEHVGSSGSGSRSRSEFLRLFDRLRIGYPREDTALAAAGQLPDSRVACSHCHAEGTAGDIGAQFLDRMTRLSSVTVAAERSLLKARRGGVETRAALEGIEQSLAAAIELQVLVHTFSVDPESPFSEKYEEGMGKAIQALEDGQEALGELRSRRLGLLVSLVFIGITLFGLYLKIRQVG